MSNHEATQTVLIVAMAIVLMAVLILELRVLRKRRRRKLQEEDLPDRAYNAVLTAKAIAQTLERSGVTSPEATDAIAEAEQSLRMRHYRVTIDLAEKAKGILRNAKKDYESRGDLAKLDRLAKEGTDEETSKERLVRELPPNYTASKFSLKLARDEVEAAKTQGRDVAEAEGLLAAGEAAFEAEDYDGALRDAVRARRGLATERAEEAPAPGPPSARTCGKCGAAIPDQDAFCRRCGQPAPERRTCGQCGREVDQSDDFCRACGARYAPAP